MPPPNSAGPLSPSRSWLTIMMPFATRTLWECQPCGRSMVASLRGWRGSATSTIVVPFGQCMWPIKSVVPSTQTCPPPGQSKCDISVVFHRLDTKTLNQVTFVGAAQPVLGRSSSGDLDDAAGGVAAPLLEQVEAFQCGLIAGDEQDGSLPVVAVNVLEPGAARHRQIVESLPVEALAIDDGVSPALERRDQQASCLPHGSCLLAGTQHLHEEGHSLEHRTAGQRVDVFDRQRLVGIAVPVFEALDQFLHRLPTIHIHRR